MKTAVIIPNWQGRTLLEKNLPKVLTVGFDEVVVVDDASTDDSVEFLQSHFPTVKLVRHKRNKGFSSTVNNGVRASNASIVFLLNSDVIPEKNILKPVLSHFKDPDVFGVSLREKGYSYAIPHIEDGFVGHRMGMRTDKTHNTFWISGGSGAFRRSMWLDLGGFDVAFDPFYWEDVDLSYRALKRGWKLVWEPKAVVEHRHESTINSSHFSTRYLNYIKERNQLLFHWKNLSVGWLLTKHFPGLIKRLNHPGYAVVIILALIKLPQLIVQRNRQLRESTISDEKVFLQFNK